MADTYVAIMAGGIGSRFWPVSRTHCPKQFLDILGTGKTLIQATFERFLTLVPAERIFVVTSTDYTGLVEEQLPGLPVANILAEPDRRNTAPCIALVAAKVGLLDPEASIIIAPSDHLILQVDRFIQTCVRALDFIDGEEAFVTLGIRPSYPNTGYGYIQFDKGEAADGVYKVKKFTEKPDLMQAKEFIESGEYLWNGGIFISKVENILLAFSQHLPQMYALFIDKLASFNTEKEEAAILDIYKTVENVSVDIGIIEKADNIYVIPADFGWSDLGTWNSAYENICKDKNENAITASNSLLIDTDNCLINIPDQKLIVVQGLQNYIVVDTHDVILICNKEKEQEIKLFVGKLKENNSERFT